MRPADPSRVVAELYWERMELLAKTTPTLRQKGHQGGHDQNRRASTSPSAVIVVISKIEGWNPVAAAMRIAHTHHVDTIPVAASLDGDFVAIRVSRTLARANVSVKEPSDSGRDHSKRWSESVAFAILNVAFPQLAGDDIDPICGVGWIMTAHDSIANRRERLGQSALNGARLRCR